MSDRREELAVRHARARRRARGTLEKYGSKPPMDIDYTAADLTLQIENTWMEQAEYWKTDAMQMRANWEDVIASLPEIERAAKHDAWLEGYSQAALLIEVEHYPSNPYEETT